MLTSTVKKAPNVYMTIILKTIPKAITNNPTLIIAGEFQIGNEVEELSATAMKIPKTIAI